MSFIKSKKAFTITELLVASGILAISAGIIWMAFSTITKQGEESKMRIEVQSNASELLATIKSYLSETEQYVIIPSTQGLNKNIKEPRFSNLVIKNKLNSKVKDLFTVIRPIQSKLEKNEEGVFEEGKKFNLSISGLNIFNDVDYDNQTNRVYYANTGLGTVEYFNLVSQTGGIIVSGLKNPTGILVTNENLYISENGSHVVKSINKSMIGNSKESSIEFETIVGTQDIVGFDGNYLNSPNGMAFGNGVLYIVDSGNNAIKTYNTKTGDLKILIAKKEDLNDLHYNLSLNNPTDIDYNEDLNAIFFSDTNNNKIIGCKLKNSETVEYCREIAGVDEAGFSGDFGLSKPAQLNRPTGIVIATDRTMYVSDSGNNLIRKIYAPFDDINLLDDQNAIKTVVGNSNIKIISIGADQVYDTYDDIRESLSAPRGGYSAIDNVIVGGSFEFSLQKNTNALLNIPTGIILVDSSPIFVDSLNGVLRAGIFDYSSDNSILLHQKPAMEDSLTINAKPEKGKIITLLKGSISAINIDNINATKLDDYISKEAIDKMFFDIKTFENPLLKIHLSLINFLKNDEPIISNIETSVSVR